MKLSKYRHLAMFTYIIGGLFLLFNNIFGTITFAIIMIVATWIAFKYNCPYCNKHFDLRFSKKTLTHCPRCGEKIYWD